MESNWRFGRWKVGINDGTAWAGWLLGFEGQYCCTREPGSTLIRMFELNFDGNQRYGLVNIFFAPTVPASVQQFTELVGPDHV